MNKEILNLFDGMLRLHKGNVKEGCEEISKNLGFKFEFILLNIIAFLRKDENLGRYCLNKTIDQISEYLIEKKD